MASNITFDHSRDCAICYTPGKETKFLECLHHFCEDCLRLIQNQDYSDTIKCPVCRQVTTLPREELPAYKPSEYGQKVKDFIEHIQVSDPIQRPCTFCGSLAVALYSCRECRVNFCIRCKPKHDVIENKQRNHIARPISEIQFCRTHLEYFTQWICHDCNIGLCILCVPEHSSHRFQDINEASRLGRKNLQTKYLKSINFEKDKKAKGLISIAEQRLGNFWEAREKSLDIAIQKAEEAVTELKKERRKSEQYVAKERLKLKIAKKNVDEFIETKENFLSCVNNLISKASDADVAFKIKKLPDCAREHAFGCNSIPTPVVNIPGSCKMKKVERALQSVDTSIFEARRDMDNKSVFSKSLRNLKQVKEGTKIYQEVLGCSLNPSMNVLSLRVVRGKKSSIQNYDYDGDWEGTFNVPIIFETYIRGIGLGFDPKSGNYFCVMSAKENALAYDDPCDMVRFLGTEEGHRSYSYFHSGVTAKFDYFCYNQDLRLYIMSSLSKKELYVIEEDSRTIKADFSTSVCLDAPKHVSSAIYFTGAEFVQAIAVTDADAIKVLGIKGELLNTFSEVDEGNGKTGSLKRPSQTLFDPEGQLLVLDRGNFRLVRFWIENGQNKSKVLYKFHESTCKGAGPHFLAYEPNLRHLFVIDKFEDCFRLLTLEED